MESDSENESIEGDVNDVQKEIKGPAASWGKQKFDYYFTDYVDKDYPSKLTRKEEKLAAIEQEEALRIQKKLFSSLDNVNLQPVIDYDTDIGSPEGHSQMNLIDFIENQNKSIVESKKKNVSKKDDKSKKRKKVKFDLEEMGSDADDFEDTGDDDDEIDDDEEEEGDIEEDDESQVSDHDRPGERKRRPINMAIKKNRGLTPYKKKEYRNPRVKHKLKYKKAMTKRRRIVKEAQTEFYRYSGETTGIKTSTIKSIKLC